MRKRLIKRVDVVLGEEVSFCLGKLFFDGFGFANGKGGKFFNLRADFVGVDIKRY